MQVQARTPNDPRRPRALVWVDARDAIIVRWADDRATIERLTSDVPGHHKSMGHIRHDPAVRHGGGGSQDKADSRRHEYLDRFLRDVARRLPAGTDLTILGPGTVHEHLIASIRAHDVEHREIREIEGRPSARMTDRQLVAMLRRYEDDEAPRRIDDARPAEHVDHTGARRRAPA